MSSAWLKRKSVVVGLLFFLWFITHSILIMYDGLNDDHQKSTYIIILGNTVNSDGSLSDRLKARVDRGLALYRQHLADTIVVSGGMGIEGHYEGKSMKNYLVSKGVSSAYIKVDDDGVNTAATARNFKTMTTGVKDNSVIVVTQFFHISRTKLILRKVGIERVYGAHADYFEWRDVYGTFREFFAYYQYWLM